MSISSSSTSAGLGIDLYPGVSWDTGIDSVSLTSNQHCEPDFNGTGSASRGHSKDLSVSSGSTSSLPYPGSDSRASIDVTESGIIRECQRIESYPSADYLGPTSADSKAETLSSTGTLAVGTINNRNAVELNTILGNAHSRLKSGAKLLQPLESEIPEEERVIALEKAKNRSCVDADIFLENNVCVEGGVLRGLVKVRIRTHPRKKRPILISGGKIRVIGFESVDDESERFTFYQCSALLSEVASDFGKLTSSGPDQEGFSVAAEGIHSVPFGFQLIRSAENGTPKGSMNIQSNISVRYIALASFRIKDPISGKKSIAHFYRDCAVWPRLNPSLVLAPTSRPLQLTASDGLRMGGSGEVYLTVSLHRLHWVAGQFCHIQVKMVNNSKKHLKTVSLELLRTVTVFKRMHKQDGDTPHYRSSFSMKQVAHSTLTMGEPGTRGHASAKGWWAGVPASETQTFAHRLLIPEDALSIAKGKLLEVSYNIRVTVSAGALRQTDVHVSLPVEVINFLSIDPPPNLDISPSSGEGQSRGKDIGAHDVMSERHGQYYNMQPISDEDAYQIESDSEGQDSDYISDEESETDGQGNLSMHDDTDELVQHAVASARIDSDYGEKAPRFADLYYSSLQENLDRAAEQFYDKIGQGPAENQTSRSEFTGEEETHKFHNFAARVEEKKLQRKVDATITETPDRSQEDLGITTDFGLPKSTCTCGASNTPAHTQAQYSPKPPLRSTISGVALPDARWEETATPRAEGLQVSDRHAEETQLRHCSPEKDKSISKSRPTTPTRRPPVGPCSPSIPRAGSVRDKIRELEVLAAQTASEAED